MLLSYKSWATGLVELQEHADIEEVESAVVVEVGGAFFNAGVVDAADGVVDCCAAVDDGAHVAELVEFGGLAVDLHVDVHAGDAGGGVDHVVCGVVGERGEGRLDRGHGADDADEEREWIVVIDEVEAV